MLEEFVVCEALLTGSCVLSRTDVKRHIYHLNKAPHLTYRLALFNGFFGLNHNFQFFAKRVFFQPAIFAI